MGMNFINALQSGSIRTPDAPNVTAMSGYQNLNYAFTPPLKLYLDEAKFSVRSKLEKISRYPYKAAKFSN